MTALNILGYGKPNDKCIFYNVFDVTDVKLVENFLKKNVDFFMLKV